MSEVIDRTIETLEKSEDEWLTRASHYDACIVILTQDALMGVSGTRDAVLNIIGMLAGMREISNINAGEFRLSIKKLEEEINESS